MENHNLKKTIGYSIAAVFLGIVLTLIPLIVLAEPKPLDLHMMLNSVTPQLKALERYANSKRTANLTDVTIILSVSFIVASVGYVFFKRRMTC
jgi:preprotein translocase subunit SecG